LYVLIDNRIAYPGVNIPDEYAEFLLLWQLFKFSICDSGKTILIPVSPLSDIKGYFFLRIVIFPLEVFTDRNISEFIPFSQA